MHLGVQGLDPAIQHLRKAGEVRDLGHRDPSLPQGLGGAPGGQNLHLAASQKLAELDDAAFIGDAWIRARAMGFMSTLTFRLSFKVQSSRFKTNQVAQESRLSTLDLTANRGNGPPEKTRKKGNILGLKFKV